MVIMDHQSCDLAASRHRRHINVALQLPLTTACDIELWFDLSRPICKRLPPCDVT